jgi:hypothetical protein
VHEKVSHRQQVSMLKDTGPSLLLDVRVFVINRPVTARLKISKFALKYTRKKNECIDPQMRSATWVRSLLIVRNILLPADF